MRWIRSTVWVSHLSYSPMTLNYVRKKKCKNRHADLVLIRMQSFRCIEFVVCTVYRATSRMPMRRVGSDFIRKMTPLFSPHLYTVLYASALLF